MRRLYLNGLLLSMLLIVGITATQKGTDSKVVYNKLYIKQTEVKKNSNIILKPIRIQLLGDNIIKFDVRGQENKLMTTIVNNSDISSSSKDEVLDRGDLNGHYTEFTLTYYTSLPNENSGYTTTCKGEKLIEGYVASNFYPLGTIIYLEGIGEVLVKDRGGKSFNSSNRLDVFIARKSGESKREYYKRVQKMGKVKVKGYIIK